MIAFYENRELHFTICKERNMNFRAHLHKQIEILYLIDGEMRITIDGITRTLVPGEIF